MDNERHARDGLEYGEDNRNENMHFEGGILKNYRKIRGQTLVDMTEGDYWSSK